MTLQIRLPIPERRRRRPLLADFRSLNDSSSSSDSSSPPPPAAGASPSFLPPLGGVLGENDPGTDFDPDEPFERPDDPPGSSTDADARRDLRRRRALTISQSHRSFDACRRLALRPVGGRPGVAARVAPDASAGARAAAAVRSAPEKCGAYVLEHDADYTGADLGVDAVAASSVGACCSACERVRLCNAFTFVAAEQQCWLKARRRMARAAPQPGALVSGHRSQLKRAGARLGFGSRGTGGGAGAAGGASAAGVQAPRRRLARPHADYAATLRLQQERQTEQLLAHAAALWRLDDGPPPPPPRFRLSLPLDAPPYTSDGAAAAPSAAMWVAWADDGAPSALLVCEAAADGLVAAAAGRPAAGRALRARSEADGGGGAAAAEAVAAEVAVAAAPAPRRRARASGWRLPSGGSRSG